MVGNHDEVHFIANGQGLDALIELAHHTIHSLHGSPCALALRTAGVAIAVGLLKVCHHKPGALGFGQGEQGNDAVYTFLQGQARRGVVVVVNGGIPAANLHVRTCPIEHSGAYALSLGGVPNGFAAIETGVGLCCRISQTEQSVFFGVIEGIGDDAVMVGIESGRQCVMVGKGLGGKGGDEVGFGTFGSHPVEEGGVIPLGVVPTTSIKRYDHGVVLLCPHGYRHEDQ